jgi:hypothetical protein
MFVNRVTLLVVCVATAAIGACAGTTSGGSAGQVGSCRKWAIRYADVSQFPPKETGETCTNFGDPCLVWTTHYHAYLNDPVLAFERVCVK